MAAAGHEYVLYQRGQPGESDAWDDRALIRAYDDAVSVMKTKLAAQHPEFSMSQTSAKTKKKKKSKSKQKKKPKNTSNTRWNVGDLCQAAYTEDNEIYEARILSINEDKATCIVQYIGYGNEEEQLLSGLLPLENVSSSKEHKTDTASETESVGRGPVQEPHSGKHRSKKILSHHQHGKQRIPKWPWNSYHPSQSFGQMPPPPPQVFQNFQPPPPFPGYQASGPNPTAPPMFPCVPPPPPLFNDRGSGEENEALYSMLISWYMSGYHTGYYQGLMQSSANASAASGQGTHR